MSKKFVSTCHEIFSVLKCY